jgi:hypothetical protein
MFLLDLKTSSGAEVAVPVALPDAITFDCFIPGRGIMSACLHPTSLDPKNADLGELDVWDPTDSTRTVMRLEGREDDAAVEQAGDVLAHVVDRLMAGCTQTLPFPPHHMAPATILRSIADMAEAEEAAVAAFRELPESIRRSMRASPFNLAVPERRPSVEAMAVYVSGLVEQAQDMAEKAAKEREGDWIAEQAEEYVAARRAERTDHAIDSWKDGR